MKVILFATLLFFICATPAQAQVVLSEVYPAPTSDEKEWIELFNTSDEPADITGWKLFEHFANKSVLTTINETIIEAKSFYVFELTSNKLNNTEEKVTLENEFGVEVSTLHYTNSESQKSFSFLFIDENEISDTLELTVPTKNIINQLKLEPTPTPTSSPTPNPTTSATPNPTTHTLLTSESNYDQSMVENSLGVTEEQTTEERIPPINNQLEQYKKITQGLKLPKLERTEKIGLEKYTPKLSYLIQTKVSDEGIISAIIGGALLLFTGLLL